MDLAKKFARETVDDYSSNGTFIKLFGCRRPALEPLVDIFVPLFHRILQLKAFLQLSKVDYYIDWPVRQGKQRFPCSSMLPLELAHRRGESHVTFAAFPAIINAQTGKHLLKSFVITERLEDLDPRTVSALKNRNAEGVILPSVEYLDTNLQHGDSVYKTKLALDSDDSRSIATEDQGWCFGFEIICENKLCQAEGHPDDGRPEWCDVKGVPDGAVDRWSVQEHLKDVPSPKRVKHLSINEVCAMQGKHLVPEGRFESPRLGGATIDSDSERSSSSESDSSFDDTDSYDSPSEGPSDPASGPPSSSPSPSPSDSPHVDSPADPEIRQTSHNSSPSSQDRSQSASGADGHTEHVRQQNHSKKRSHDDSDDDEDADQPRASAPPSKRARLMPRKKQSTAPEEPVEQAAQAPTQTSPSPNGTRSSPEDSADEGEGALSFILPPAIPNPQASVAALLKPKRAARAKTKRAKEAKQTKQSTQPTQGTKLRQTRQTKQTKQRQDNPADRQRTLRSRSRIRRPEKFRH